MMFSGMAWNCKAAMFFAAYPVLNFTFTSRCQPDVSQTTSLGGSGNSTWIDGSLSFLAVRRAENSCFHLSFLRITSLSLLLILSCIMIASQQLATSFPIWHRQSLFASCFNLLSHHHIHMGSWGPSCQEPGEVYYCFGNKVRCPGGEPGTCAFGRDRLWVTLVGYIF